MTLTCSWCHVSMRMQAMPACLPACLYAGLSWQCQCVLQVAAVLTYVCKAQVPKLCGLVKRGIGLNTRTGCARFIISLTTRQGADIKPHTAAFIKVTNLPQRGAAQQVQLQCNH